MCCNGVGKGKTQKRRRVVAIYFLSTDKKIDNLNFTKNE